MSERASPDVAGTLCSMYKWQDCLPKRDFPFVVKSETWGEQEGLQNTGEGVVSWASGSEYRGGSEKRLLLQEQFLFPLSKAHRD